MNAGYEYSLQPRVAGGIDFDTIKIGPDTPKKTLPFRFRQEASHRVQNGKSSLAGESPIRITKFPLQQGHTSTLRASSVSRTLPTTSTLVQAVRPNVLLATTKDWPT